MSKWTEAEQIAWKDALKGVSAFETLSEANQGLVRVVFRLGYVHGRVDAVKLIELPYAVVEGVARDIGATLTEDGA